MFRRLPIPYILVGSEEIVIPPHKRAQLMNIKEPAFPMIPYEYVLYTRYEDLATPGVKMGIVFETSSTGLMVKKVIPGSAAEQAGLKEADILVQLDGETLNETFDLTYALQQKKTGASSLLVLKRGGELLKVEIVFSAQTQ
jgi:S1-C subfamily serine protease